MEHASIAYDTVECPLGWLLVAATHRGLCNVRFGEDPERLAAELRAEFPYAVLERDPRRVAAWADALLRCVAGEPLAAGLPLDVRGSQFQRRVWQAIRSIPRGATRTYGELAAQVGAPRAARAVARACGANPVPLAVPCHRVVGAGGALGGYHYGTARKRALLDAEARDLSPRNVEELEERRAAAAGFR